VACDSAPDTSEEGSASNLVVVLQVTLLAHQLAAVQECKGFKKHDSLSCRLLRHRDIQLAKAEQWFALLVVVVDVEVGKLFAPVLKSWIFESMFYDIRRFKTPHTDSI
jgi:hypothetical protein